MIPETCQHPSSTTQKHSQQTDHAHKHGPWPKPNAPTPPISSVHLVGNRLGYPQPDDRMTILVLYLGYPMRGMRVSTNDEIMVGTILTSAGWHEEKSYLQYCARGLWEFINYLGSIFFVKALGTSPPYQLPNEVCFHPKRVCFFHPSVTSCDVVAILSFPPPPSPPPDPHVPLLLLHNGASHLWTSRLKKSH